MLEAHLNLNQSMSPDKQGLVDGEPQRADDDDRLVAQDVCDQEHDQSLDYTGVDGHRVDILRHLDRQLQLGDGTARNWAEWWNAERLKIKQNLEGRQLCYRALLI